MHIETIQPHPALQKFIDFYYFIREDAPDFESKHYSFPHTVNVVSIYKQANYRSSADEVDVYHDQQHDFLTLIQGKCQLPLKVVLTGKTNRISIFFKSFGLNQFIKVPLSAVMTNKTNAFNQWDEYPAYRQCLEKCFATDNLQEKIDLLEGFLLSILNPIANDALETAVRMLSDFTHEYKIEAICKTIDIPLRTFNRQFKSVIGVSPAEFRNIARFRHSLNNKFFSSQFKRLTDIGYDSNFYDQSYFIKIYRKLTGSNPSAFFEAVDKLGNDKLIFQFINKYDG